MTLKAILFDLDGTLADTIPLCLRSYQMALEPLMGRPVSEGEITAHFGLTEAGIFQKIIPNNWEEGLKTYFQIYEEHHIECSEPFPKITTALDLLKSRGIQMAVVTGKGDYSANYTLKYIGLAGYFSKVAAGSEDAIIKSRAINEILTTWAIQPDEAAYIGDADTDIREAELAGVLPLAAAWSANATIGRLEQKPELSFTSIDAFIQWIEENIS